MWKTQTSLETDWPKHMTWLRCFLWNFNLKRLSFNRSSQGSSRCIYVHLLILHSLTHCTNVYWAPVIQLDLYTDGRHYSKRDFRGLFAFLVSRPALKSVSPLPSVFLVYVVKSVNINSFSANIYYYYYCHIIQRNAYFWAQQKLFIKSSIQYLLRI